MKHFSLKILLLCILLPPILYVVTFQLIEGKIQSDCTREIEEIPVHRFRSLLRI